MRSTTRPSGPSGTRGRSRGATSAPSTFPGARTDGGDPRALAAVDRGDRPPLELLPASEGRVESLLEFVWSVPRSEADFVNVVVPELFHKRSLLRGVPQDDVVPAQAAPAEGAGRRDHRRAARRRRAAGRRARGRARVLVSGVHGASLRAIAYAADARARRRPRGLLRVRRRRGARDPRDWERFGVRLPLDIVEAPFRDLGDPLRTYLRPITADGHGRRRRHARARRPRLAPAAPQPAGALPQAAAPLRAAT